MSSTIETYWDRLVFSAKLYRCSGEAFQSIASQVFEIRMPGFQPITPWGNWGDGGNDGWIKTAGHYFQVYGPKATTNYSPLDAVGKAVDDFAKLPEKWTDIRRYSFVLNDRFEGVPAPVASALQKLAKDHALEDAEAIGSGRLLNEFLQLSRDQKQMIIGGIPSSVPDFVDARAVGELLAALADNGSAAVKFLGTEKAPAFEEKLVFNGISSPVADCIRMYSYQTAVVDEFLNPRDLGLKQSISREIRDLYESSKIVIPSNHGDPANMRYAWMMEQLIPDYGSKHPHTLKAFREAAQIVIAKYFETCDAYDEPVSSTSP